jgi:NAD(P)-dependent dehydrogenase (short-subunit alcohol dehydrogenase family)
MMMERTILVTGASGNLGSAVVRKFLGQNFRVAALDRPADKIRGEKSGRLRFFPVDLGDEPRVSEVLDEVYRQFGSIEMAVLTVGGFAMGRLAATGMEDMDRMYRLNFLTAFIPARQLFSRMEGQEGGGQLVFIGTRPALQPEQAKNMVAYALSKSLLFRLAEVINEDGRKGGITASVVIPSTMDTPQNRSAMPDADFSKWVSPDEVAENILHLVAPAGRKLRETILKVYGGS